MEASRCYSVAPRRTVFPVLLCFVVLPVFRAWSKTSHGSSAAQASSKGTSRAAVTRRKKKEKQKKKMSVVEIRGSRAAMPLAA